MNAFYRSVGPMAALAARGHETLPLLVAEEAAWPATLRRCELLHIHRVCDEATLEYVRMARSSGAAVVWDDDDDVTKAPKGTPGHRQVGGLRGQRRLAARAKLFSLVDLVTTPSAHLAEVFRSGGAPRVEVIENYVADAEGGARRGSHEGVTIGWVAEVEHQAELEHLPIQEALARVLAAHPEVAVTSIGIDLHLRGDRYRHVPYVSFHELARAVAAFDVGIAPLTADSPINRARSNVKLKEYAVAGVPWLASPTGPYVGMGEAQGGRLVEDARWREALEELVQHGRRRKRLAKRAARWGRSQTIARNVGLWERALAAAREHARDEGHAA